MESIVPNGGVSIIQNWNPTYWYCSALSEIPRDQNAAVVDDLCPLRPALRENPYLWKLLAISCRARFGP